MLTSYTWTDAVHLIQAALTPVFLLSAIGVLLNVFAGRLARVSDQLASLTNAVGSSPPSRQQAEQLELMKRRSVALDVAVVLSTIASAATCLTIMTLFLFVLSERAIAGALLLFFAVAVACTLGAVISFGIEMVLSSRALRRRIHLHMPHLSWPGQHRH